MAAIPVTIAHSLSVERSVLPAGVEDEIRQHLTIANGDKEKALRLGQYGADDMPDFFDLWGVEGNRFTMPRGYAATLRAGLQELGHDIAWIDETVAPAVPLRQVVQMRMIDTFAKGDHQEPTVLAMLLHRQGIVSAPAASGKTVEGLEAFRRAGVRGIVLVDRTSLAEQWRARAREHLGIEAGLIQGPPETWQADAPLVVAMVQTLYRYTHAMGAPRQDEFGLMIVDEAHHAIAETWRWVIAWFLVRYLFGMTATPLDNDWRRPMLEALIGPVFHTTDRKALNRHGVLSRPEVHVIRTDFKWQSQGADRRLRDERTIYKRIIDSLLRDSARNELVVQQVMARRDAAQLINSERKAQLETLFELVRAHGYPEERIFWLTGAENEAERQETSAAAEQGNCLIFSTLAREGLDIPRLDVLHLVWPVRKHLRVKQLIGRVERKHPAKKRSLILDYADFKQGVLRSQFFSRLEVYNEHGYVVLGLKKPEEER